MTKGNDTITLLCVIHRHLSWFVDTADYLPWTGLCFYIGGARFLMYDAAIKSRALTPPLRLELALPLVMPITIAVSRSLKNNFVLQDSKPIHLAIFAK